MISFTAAACLLLSTIGTGFGSGQAVRAEASAALDSSFITKLNIEKIGEYSLGVTNKDGGVAEIVKYNKDNGKFYLVNGSGNPPSLDIVSLGNGKGSFTKEHTILVQSLAETNGFRYGDLTSVDVNTTTKRISVSVQEADPIKPGKILVLDYDGNLLKEYGAGVQPDMIKSTADGRYILTADEGEPRTAAGDPKGSITIVDTTTDTAKQVYFDDELVIGDDVYIRGASDPVTGLIMGKGSKADALYDFEPEYIALSSDNKQAYVTLQENNAVAVIDIGAGKVNAVKTLGFKDYNDPRNSLDLVSDGTIKLENVPFKGMYMPDGIASQTINGSTYLFTANEGDATEWPVEGDTSGWAGRKNAVKLGSLKGQLDSGSAAGAFLNGTNAYDDVEVVSGVGTDSIYMYGGRSFSIRHADTMEQVYDSGNDFETITSQGSTAEYFNSSHSKVKMDDRSPKKGPEPEDVKTGVVGNKVLAFVGLERIGGFMTYDVTDPAHANFVNYTNTRVFLDSKGKANLDTDTGPEGLEFIPAEDSPTGQPLLLVAYEVGGKVSAYQLNVTKVSLDQTSLSIKTGDAPVKLQATVIPANGASETVEWTSSNPAVASVDADGRITPLSAGTAVIRVVSADGYAVAESTVTVTASSSGGGNNPGGGTAPGTGTGTEPGTPVVSGDTVQYKKGDFAALAAKGPSELTIQGNKGTIVLDKKAVQTVGAAAGQQEVSFKIAQKDAASLYNGISAEARASIEAAIGSRPVYDITIAAGGKEVSDLAGGKARISIPYTLQPGENSNAVVVYYVSKSGELILVPNGRYDASTGKLQFTVGHFSNYGAGYHVPGFTDIGKSFAQSDIIYLSARNVIGGISADRFAPKSQLTRGDFTLLLARMSGEQLGGYATDRFTDVAKSAYYAQSVAWAADKGIVGGISEGKFAPGDSITREQMAVMLVRFASVAGLKLPEQASSVTFADQAKISAFASDAVRTIQQAGFMNGKELAGGRYFAPQDHTTREEAAKLLASFMKLLA
ncbi:choice-of-anchor I family protein [Paenibacillus sp. NPDC058174]|uniref:choice-of-anchor I family protein n=1 Tax=Paenibacillus sp. NPDC058174 TaxID=3346366 RepID=UPI0036DC86E8